MLKYICRCLKLDVECKVFAILLFILPSENVLISGTFLLYSSRRMHI